MFLYIRNATLKKRRGKNDETKNYRKPPTTKSKPNTNNKRKKHDTPDAAKNHEHAKTTTQGLARSRRKEDKPKK